MKTVLECQIDQLKNLRVFFVCFGVSFGGWGLFLVVCLVLFWVGSFFFPESFDLKADKYIYLHIETSKHFRLVICFVLLQGSSVFRYSVLSQTRERIRDIILFSYFFQISPMDNRFEAHQNYLSFSDP